MGGGENGLQRLLVQKTGEKTGEKTGVTCFFLSKKSTWLDSSSGGQLNHLCLASRAGLQLCPVVFGENGWFVSEL